LDKRLNRRHVVWQVVLRLLADNPYGWQW